MNTPQEPRRKSTDTGRIWAGAIILGLGIALLLNRLDIHWIFFPGWIFSWPMVLIVVGLVIGGSSNFRNPASYITLIIGGFFLVNNIWDLDIKRYIWPAAIIAVGLWLLADRKQKHIPPSRPAPGKPNQTDPSTTYAWDKRIMDDPLESAPTDSGAPHASTAADPAQSDQNAYAGSAASGRPTADFTDEDYVKITSLFGDIRRMVLSKNFLGGEVVNMFGGSDINLIQADIKHPVTIDMFQMFGGSKIIVPSHWKVKSEVVSVFGDVDDRRFIHNAQQHDENKILYIRGTSIFGGITIKSI